MGCRRATGWLFFAAIAWAEAAAQDQADAVWPQAFECPRYTVSVEQLSLHHKERSLSKYTVWLNCKFHDRINDEKLGAIQPLNESIAGNSDAGALKFAPDTYSYIGRVQQRVSGLTFTLEVPANATVIENLECKFLGVYPAPPEKLVWELPLKENGETKTYGNFKFTLDSATIEEKSASFEYTYKMPVPDNQSERWPRAFMEARVTLDDGTEARGSGGGSAQHGSMQVSLNKHRPKNFMIAFVPRVREEELSFSLKNIKLPVAEIDAKLKSEDPPGARRFDSPVANLELSGVEVYRQLTPKRDTVRLNMLHIAKNFQKTGAFLSVKDVAATDDMGRELELNGAPFTPQVDFKLPDRGIRRLKSFRGVYSLLNVDELEKIVFELPPATEKFEKPVERGPITLNAVSYGKDYVNVAFGVRHEALPGPEWAGKGSAQSTGMACGVSGMEYDLIDVAEQSCKCRGSGYSTNKDQHQITAHFTEVSKGGLKLVIYFPKKGHAAEIPFEFKDIDLPVYSGKGSQEKEDAF